MAIVKSMIRIRISEHDVHYAGGLVDGAKLMQLFGDVATEILIRNDGDEGLFRAYEMVEFLAPVYAGDYLEVTGELLSSGTTSRKIRFEAKKVVSTMQSHDEFAPSAATLLDEPIMVARAVGTCVVLEECQRYKHKK